MMQELINQAVKLPALLNKFDTIGSSSGTTTFDAMEQLRDDSRNFIESLWKWESNLETKSSLPLYWSKSATDDSSHPSTNILWYPNIMTANSLTYCWAFEIIARMQLAVLEKATLSVHENDSFAILRRLFGLGTQKPLAVLAEMICDSMSYLLQADFKLYGPGSAFFTLPTAIKVFQSEPDRYAAQLARCHGIIDHLNSIGVFFPQT